MWSTDTTNMASWVFSTLVQVMACRQSASCHYLKKCWAIVHKILATKFSGIWIKVQSNFVQGNSIGKYLSVKCRLASVCQRYIIQIRKSPHDDVIKWKHFPRYWPFVRGIRLSPVDSPYKGQWRGAFVFPLICAWTNGWASSRDAGDLRRHRAHYDVTVMPSRRQNASRQLKSRELHCQWTSGWSLVMHLWLVAYAVYDYGRYLLHCDRGSRRQIFI